MTRSLDQFARNLDRSRDLLGMYVALKASVTPALDVSDVLRAGIVMTVSALDHLVHELVLEGMLGTIAGARPATDAFRRFDVSVASTQEAMSDPSVHTWLEYEIRTRHGWLSFQQPDKIADAIRLISDASLWKDVGLNLSEDPTDLKRRLSLIVQRRNKIAHEADIDPTIPGARWPIGESDLQDSIAFIESLGTAIATIAV